MKVAFFTLGCKVNQYETEVIRSEFIKKGFESVSCDDIADVYVVNSCSVTAVSDKKSRQQVRHFKHKNPNAVIVLTGCFSQAFPEKAKELNEANIITGTKDKSKIPELVLEFIKSKEKLFCVSSHENGEAFEKMESDCFFEKTRAFVKIEDGCDRFCSYCIIPYARGRVRSKSLEDLKSELIKIAKNGYKEVVLVGINLACYGRDIGLRLIDAVEIACSVESIERVRLGSFEPEMLYDDDLKRFAVLKKFCPQFHISLQSGCDETLKRMHRNYSSDEYAEIVRKINSAFENPAITTDVMVGFSGETEEEFEKSLSFVKSIGFSKVHVFPYSVRGGTIAEKYPDRVSAEVKSARAKEMQAAADAAQAEYLSKQIGRATSVLIEQYKENSYYNGYTKNYVPIKIYSESLDENILNSIVNVKIVSAKSDYCIAEFI